MKSKNGVSEFHKQAEKHSDRNLGGLRLTEGKQGLRPAKTWSM